MFPTQWTRRCFLSRASSSRTQYRNFRSRDLRPTPSELRRKLQERLNGTVDHFVFGSCEHGQLGIGETEHVILGPKRLEIDDEYDVKKYIIGHNHSIAILNDGGALSWGFNQMGQCGQGHKDVVSSPKPIQGLEGHKVQDGACGPLQTFLITDNLRTGKQAVWHCGMNYWDERPPPKFTLPSEVPRKLKRSDFMDPAIRIQKVIPAGDFCFFLTEQRQLYAFGLSGDHGALGLGRSGLSDIELEKVAGPRLITDLKSQEIVDAQVGWGHTLALTSKGTVYSWGSNVHGQLGHNIRSHIWNPRMISFFQGIQIEQIACGETHSLARDKDHNVYSWGSHAEGKLGLGDIKDDVDVPRKIDFFDGKQVIHIACGTDHSAALTASGDIYLWGFGQHGALSIETEFRNAFTPIMLPKPDFKGRIMNKEKYPFLVDGQRVSTGAVLSKHYGFRAVDVQCGMDLTFIAVFIKAKDGFIDRITFPEEFEHGGGQTIRKKVLIKKKKKTKMVGESKDIPTEKVLLKKKPKTETEPLTKPKKVTTGASPEPKKKKVD